MAKNIGHTDRIIRKSTAIFIFPAYIFDLINGPAAGILVLSAGLIVFTTLINHYFLYDIIGLNTNRT
jgi:hypothetical protein